MARHEQQGLVVVELAAGIAPEFGHRIPKRGQNLR
jgi:hypothetical protein